MGDLDRGRLLDLLEADFGAESKDAAALLRAGAEVTFYASVSTPGSHFEHIYRRRAEHVRRIGLDARGLDEAVGRFARAESVDALATIHAVDRDYSVFLSGDAHDLVACISTTSA